MRDAIEIVLWRPLTHQLRIHMPTKIELQAENEALREALINARDTIADAIGELDDELAEAEGEEGESED